MIEKIREFIDPFTHVGINKIDSQLLGMFIFAVDSVIKTLANGEAIPADEAYQFISYSHIFANMVAVTPYQNTDQWIPLVDGDLCKTMFLNTAYNKTRLCQKDLFDYNVDLASLWFAQYVQPIIGCVTPQIQQNVKQHYKRMDARCRFLPESTQVSFWSDYISPEIATAVKQQFNRSIVPAITETISHPRNMAIITGHWKPTHAVVRTMGKLVYALADKYRLSLIHLGPIHKDADLSPFRSVRQVSFENGQLDVSEISMTDFGTALFLEVGLTPESIHLANMRLAPLQITCHGHPVSGRGNQIDYFLTGESVEKSPRYSEKLIMLPGSGVLPELPTYHGTNQKPLSKRIAVPWSAVKYNIPMFKALRTLQEKGGAKLVFFPGNAIHRYQASIPVRMAMLKYFGPSVTILPNLSYAQYMNSIESCQFSVDSYPFGGYNTVLDSLWCRRPVITLEGDEWYNRVASYLLHRASMSELVAKDRSQYVEIGLAMLNDANFLTKMQRKCKKINFEHLVGQDKVEDFVTAIDKLVGQHFGGDV
jgi:hypothetical protein